MNREKENALVKKKEKLLRVSFNSLSTSKDRTGKSTL